MHFAADYTEVSAVPYADGSRTVEVTLYLAMEVNFDDASPGDVLDFIERALNRYAGGERTLGGRTVRINWRCVWQRRIPGEIPHDALGVALVPAEAIPDGRYALYYSEQRTRGGVTSRIDRIILPAEDFVETTDRARTRRERRARREARDRLETGVAHETGHFFGLGHNASPESVMYRRQLTDRQRRRIRQRFTDDELLDVLTHLFDDGARPDFLPPATAGAGVGATP